LFRHRGGSLRRSRRVTLSCSDRIFADHNYGEADLRLRALYRAVCISQKGMQLKRVPDEQ